MLRTITRSLISFSLSTLGCLALFAHTPAHALTPYKTIVKDMDEAFSIAVSETTIEHVVYFNDIEGSTADWGVINYRQGQPNAWNIVSGTHSCVGKAWWCGQSGFTYGDGYDNNWVQTLKTVTPIDLSGTSGNELTFKYRAQTEWGFDWGWVLIHDGAAGSAWDTLASFSGDFGASCTNATISIPNSWTTRPQPIQLQFLFGSDLTVSTADSSGAFTGWTLDDVKITAAGSIVKFFDDMEAGSGNWLASSPNPGTLWHVENSPGTSVPATCFFLSTNLWVPFQGFGFGLVPDFVDAMLTSPPMDLQGVFNGPNTELKLRFDDWINLPFDHGVYWSLWVSGSDDLVTWTPWRNHNASIVFSGGTARCIEGHQTPFNPYNTVSTGIQPGTRYLRIGFRLRDEKQLSDEGLIMQLGAQTEGIYLDNIKVLYVYTISGVETVSGVPASARASVQKIFPNPFNPNTTIEFSVPKAGPTSLRIYDVQGKPVASLVNETMPAGVYRVRWNGKSDGGRELSSGVYFALVETSKGRDSARLMMLK